MKSSFHESYRRIMHRGFAAFTGLLLLGWSCTAHGGGAEAGYAGKRLPAIRMSAAAPVWLADRKKGPSDDYYENLSPEEKERLIRKYRQWKSLPPEKRQQLRNKMHQFKELPPDSRRLYEHRFQQWQQLSPSERQRIRKDLDNWQNLSPQQQEIILRRFRD